MKIELLKKLRCPLTGQHLTLEKDTLEVVVETGFLVSEDKFHRYPIINGIPRFVSGENYADNFGVQWNRFAKTQLDSFSGQTISADRFWKATNWVSEELQGQWVLDVGCGAGRFAEVALNAGAIVVALDYSNAVDACYRNLRHFQNFHVIQADIYSLPFTQESFPFVYSLGVLQHTPEVGRAFSKVVSVMAKGGKICVDFYWKRFRTMLHIKYLLRPFTIRISQQKLYHYLDLFIPTFLKISQFLGKVPLIGRVIKRLIPVADYTNIFPLDQHQLKEWALLDTFDMLAPKYDNPQSIKKIISWASRDGLEEVDILHVGHLVLRARKSMHVCEKNS